MGYRTVGRWESWVFARFGYRKQGKRFVNDEDEETKFEEDIEEVMKLDPYIERGRRPVKLRLKTQTATEEILARTYKLRDIKEYKDVVIKKRMQNFEN